MHLERKDVPQMILDAYTYNGRMFELEQCESVTLNNACWSGGTKSDYMAINLDTGEVSKAKSTISNPFKYPMPVKIVIPPRTVIVSHRYFCGKDMGLKIYARGEDITPLLPPKSNLSEDEKIVLYHTRSLKSSYAGIKNYRFHEASRNTGITATRWDSAKDKLKKSKHLNKAGAITPKGRNVVEDVKY